MLVNSILEQKPEIMSECCGEKIVHLGAQTYLPQDTIEFRVYTVSKEHIARPDLISKLVYGTDMYGDIICKLNGISNPFELNEGMNIAIPKLEDVEQFIKKDYFDDNVESDVESEQPKPKSRKEKRQANDAIIGDTRFKIDRSRNVIIY